MKFMAKTFAAFVSLMTLASSAESLDGWTPKFYEGLEAAGEVVVRTNGFRGTESAIELKWTAGMPKFGAAKRFPCTLKGVQDWMVSAQVRCTLKGGAAVAIEFFDERDKSLGVLTGPTRTFTEWTPLTWKFTSPRTAKRASVHLLSMEKAPVFFSRVAVTSVPGIDKNEIPFAMVVLPAQWNRDWNGGRTRMTSFSDAPIPMTVLLRGNLKELRKPAFEIDLPDDLELKDAYCAHTKCYGHETPVSEMRTEKDGSPLTRIRFEGLRYFAFMDAVRYDGDSAGGISLVVGPKPGGEKMEKTATVVCRVLDGERLADERDVELVFRPLPTGLKTAKSFVAMGWRVADRLISDDHALETALSAYEAAGLRMFRLETIGSEEPKPLPRAAEVRRILEGRSASYLFVGRVANTWRRGHAHLSSRDLARMGGNMSKMGGKAGGRGKFICPEFFTTNAEFHHHLEEKAILPRLKASGLKDGDWVTLDMEPWQAYNYCFCDRCLRAFGEFAKLDHAPTMEEAQKMQSQWTEFRVRHSAKSIEIISGIIHRYNPTLKVVDYDYILEYGNPRHRSLFLRNCAKDTLMNETWLDGHLCCYYRRVGRSAFEAIKNNMRTLKKTYVPMGALSGYASWIRPGEVLNPRQVRQFAFAAFVNGCPGYAFYPGNYFDGEMLLGMMDVQNVVAQYEDLPWGKVQGKAVVGSQSGQFAFTSTMRSDGTEVVALFNYDVEDRIRVDVAGTEYELGPLDVKFVEVK